MIFLLSWFIFIFIFLLIFVIVLCIDQVNLSNNRNHQYEINKNAMNKLKNSYFNISKIFYINDISTYNQENSSKKFIAIDQDNKKICLIDYAKDNLFIINFNEVLSYEIYENGSTATTGGGLGGWFGGIFGAESEGKCKELKLLIKLKRYDVSQITYDIISNTAFNWGITKSEKRYINCISTLKEVTSFLEVIKNENNFKAK